MVNKKTALAVGLENDPATSKTMALSFFVTPTLH